jgi:hypothetical protein
LQGRVLLTVAGGQIAFAAPTLAGAEAIAR